MSTVEIRKLWQRGQTKLFGGGRVCISRDADTNQKLDYSHRRIPVGFRGERGRPLESRGCAGTGEWGGVASRGGCQAVAEPAPRGPERRSYGLQEPAEPARTIRGTARSRDSSGSALLRSGDHTRGAGDRRRGAASLPYSSSSRGVEVQTPHICKCGPGRRTRFPCAVLSIPQKKKT